MDIDFVVLWVDGNDPEWRAEKAKYQGAVTDDSNSVNRFRDWGLMPYWFRAVEKFTPWVHKIHFVTCGRIPEFGSSEIESCLAFGFPPAGCFADIQLPCN